MNFSIRDQQVIWHPYTQAKLSDPPIAIVKGEGTYLYDDNGNRYIDAVSSWWVNIHGHANLRIAKKVFDQLQKLEHVMFAGFTHEPGIELAEKLLKILPSNQARVFYSDNGSTATEVAVKMAVQYWKNIEKKRNKIIAFEYSYHGDTFGAMSVSSRSSFTEPFADLLFNVIHVPLPLKGHESEAIQYMRDVIEKNKGEIAAFIFEPLILGAGGMLMYEADILETLLNVCIADSILLIADEVMTGFGRTGKYFACEYLNVQPDIICLSKGITGGALPLGVTTCTSKVYNAFLSTEKLKTFFHGHSYTANPVACAAALASYELLTEEACMDNINRIVQKHLLFIKKNNRSPVLTNLRCRGTILAMDIETGEPTSYFNSSRDSLYTFFLSQGIILRPLGNTIYVMPPYCISNIDLDYIYTVLESITPGFGIGGN